MRISANYKKIHWTEHSKIKMKQYGLSKQKILGILHNPERIEEAIVPGLVAAMKTNPAKRTQGVLNGTGKKFSKWGNAKRAPGEIWLMYKDSKDFRKIISAWRYPGISKPGEEIPIPDDIKNDVIRGIII